MPSAPDSGLKKLYSRKDKEVFLHKLFDKRCGVPRIHIDVWFVLPLIEPQCVGRKFESLVTDLDFDFDFLTHFVRGFRGYLLLLYKCTKSFS